MDRAAAADRRVSRPSGKPTQNAYIERFNGTFRREVLNANAFGRLAQVRQTVDAWLVEYNTERPHQALQFMTPTVGRCRRIPAGGLNSSQNWLTKGGKDMSIVKMK